MTYVVDIHDWPFVVEPIHQVYTAGGQITPGGVTLGGTLIASPEPGGRGVLKMEFAPIAAESSNIEASYAMSLLEAHVVFKVPLYPSIQLLPIDALIAGAADVPWDHDQSWDNLFDWEALTEMPFTGSVGLVGASTLTFPTTLVADASLFVRGLVFGLRTGINVETHVITKVEESVGVTTLSIRPPLRKTIDDTTTISTAPYMYAQCENPDSFIAMFRRGRHAQPGELTFSEVHVP